MSANDREEYRRSAYVRVSTNFESSYGNLDTIGESSKVLPIKQEIRTRAEQHTQILQNRDFKVDLSNAKTGERAILKHLKIPIVRRKRLMVDMSTSDDAEDQNLKSIGSRTRSQTR